MRISATLGVSLATLGVSFALAFAGPAYADPFASGSTGALGNVVIAANTAVVLPPDGILNYASLTVKSGVTLTFTANTRNTPVFILASGDIVIEPSAILDVSGRDGNVNGLPGRGGPGGFDGGANVDSQVLASAGQGPGAGLANVGSLGSSGGNAGYSVKGGGGLTQIAGQPYGSQLLLPLIGGSGGGGGGGHGGGGGGGAILLASTTRIALGTGAIVRSRGGAGYGGYQAGSGGAVRLLAPVVSGSATLDVSSGGGGHGRARVDTLDTSALDVTAPSARFTVATLMVAFLDAEPQIDLIGVGQASIPLGYEGEFLVILPTGASATQTVTLSLTDFFGTVPITVALTPDSGNQILYNADVDTSSAVDGVVTFDIDVDFPPNVATVVRVWTRPPAN